MSFLARAGAVAVAAAGANAVPVPAVGSAFNLAVILKEVHSYRRQFGLPDEGSEIFKALRAESISIILKYSFKTADELLPLFADSAVDIGIEELTKFIPVAGQFLSAASAFVFVFKFLYQCISDMEKAAFDIWDKTVKGNAN